MLRCPYGGFGRVGTTLDTLGQIHMWERHGDEYGKAGTQASREKKLTGDGK